MKARRILVFSPHPDDEIIGCGGTLALAHANGAKVKVVVITDGEKKLLAHHSPQLRKEECITGMEILGIDDVTFWGYPDQAIPLSGSIIEHYQAVVAEFIPDYILLPSPYETHPDHIRTTRGILKALEGNWKGTLLFYETMQPILINTTYDISRVIELKRLALLAHASQSEQYNYEEFSISMARLRGLAVGQDYAEGFLSYNWDGSNQNFFETRPLISVIVRTDNLLFLRNALQSLILQKYDQLEVILVWYGTEKVDSGEFEYLDIQLIHGKTLRSYNLNLGLHQVKGEYVAFFDQDDILYPNHFELLLSHLHGNNAYDIAYTGCKVLHCEMRDGKPYILSEEGLYNHSYQQGRLIIGNYIPIHSLLFRHTVFRSQKFDETLSAYEDWEMLARLEMAGCQFLHIDSITCEYHLFGHSDFSLEQIHKNKGYLSEHEVVLSTILKKLSLQNLKHLSDLVSSNESRISELEKLIDREQDQLEKRQIELSEYRSIEEFLSRGLKAVGIENKGREGITTMIGRLLSPERLFSVILPVCNTPADILEETLLSISNQVYTGWELCLVDDASNQRETKQLLSDLKKHEMFRSKLREMRHKKREGIVPSLNDAVAMARMPYLVFLDHDDLLHKEALLTLAMTIKSEKMYSLLYTDSRTIDLTGKPLHIFHKPDWAPDNLLHGNYINHLTVVRRQLLNQIGGFRQEYEGAQDLDLLLRLSAILKDDDVRHIDMPLYDWRATSDSVAYSGSAKPHIFESARKAIADHLITKKIKKVSVERNPHGIGFSCNWQTREKEIEIIIPTKNNLAGLKSCIEGLFYATDYPRFSVTVVSNNSNSKDMISYLETLRKKDRIRIIIDNRPFNWSALNNKAVAKGSAPIILFMNDDVEVKDRMWLMNMSRYLMLDDVGVVGATLFYPDESLQHNGIMTNENWVAANITTWGQKRELTATRNVSAVTGACLLIKRNTLKFVGGLNEKLPRSYNDVDLCLNVRTKGLRILQASDVQLIHLESESCGSLDSSEKKEEWERSSAFMRNKWKEMLKERYIPSYKTFAHFTKIVQIS
jgi:LmbE family N-acetylglucosaminyl deacetylase/GT2 family glycosyltransferase